MDDPLPNFYIQNIVSLLCNLVVPGGSFVLLQVREVMEGVGSVIGGVGKPSIPSVLVSAKFIVSRAQHVTISLDGVIQTARKVGHDIRHS